MYLNNKLALALREVETTFQSNFDRMWVYEKLNSNLKQDSRADSDTRT